MTEKKKTKREQESERKKAEICSVAEKLFAVYGYDQTTLQDISEASGYSIGSLYNFFKTKENILMEISRDMASIPLDLTDAEKKAEDPIGTLMDYLLAYARNWEEIGVDLTNSIYRTFLKSYVDPGSIGFHHMDFMDSLVTFIQLAQDKGTMSKAMSAEDTAAYLITQCRGLLYEWCIFGGTYSLTDKSRIYLPFILSPFAVGK